MKKYFALVLTALVLLAILAIGASAVETFINPVTNGADPFVFKDTDGTYYLYVTSGGAYGYRVYTSTNLVEWEAQGYCLRRSDVYTDPEINKLNSETGNTSAIYNFWAPEVIKEGDTYYMVYSAQEHIGIATSDSPLGPFTNDATSYLIPHTVTGRNDEGVAVSTQKCIDGHFFKDDNGQLYLYFVSCGNFSLNGDSIDHGNNIWGGPFNLETLTFAEGYPKKLVEHDNKNEVTYDGWKNTSSLSFLYPNRYDGSAVAEGPEMLKHNGKYYLTFSQDGYTSSQYSVFYVTADNPMGPYSAKKLAFISDDQLNEDTDNPHLYGTAHHCFTTSPDGSELIMVYHAHRSATDPNNYGNTVEERRICIDLAGFDEDGTFWAGRNTKGHPTATAQALPAGGTLTRTQNLTGSFADLATLPTVYVAFTDGNDTAAGTKAAPLKTLTAAYAALPNGGTIILTQTYNAVSETSSDYCSLPAVNGPIMIKGEFSAVPIRFKFIKINSDTYFDNICFWPETANNIALIECNFNNVVMGEGVSCIAQPTRATFPVLVGGKWLTGNSGGAYENFKPTSAQLVSDKEFTLTVLSGTWSIATEKSLRSLSQVANSTPNATIVLDGDAKVRPAKASAPTVVASSDGAKITLNAINHAEQYVIYKNGEVLGYTADTTYVDETYAWGETAEYSYAGYINGACIGDAGTATSFTFVADVNADNTVDVLDVVIAIKALLNGDGNTLLNILVLLKLAV